MIADTDQILHTLVEKAKNGDEAAFNQILKILDNEIKKLANKYYIVGSDENDVIQECRIGIWKAVKDFDSTAGMTFKNFSLSLCCKRHLITAMSHANTQKFKLQNEAVSLSAPVSQSEDDGMQTYADYITDPNCDLLDQYVVNEEFETNLHIISDKLTKLEMAIFSQYAYDSSYKEIAKALNVKPKAVDNALMRIRRKGSESYAQYSNHHNVINFGICSEAIIGVCTFTNISIGICSNMMNY